MPKQTVVTLLLLIGTLASALCLYLSFLAGCAGDTKGGSLGDVQAALKLEGLSLAPLLVAIVCLSSIPLAGLKSRLTLRVAASVAVVVASLGVLVLLSIQLEIYGVQRCFSQVSNFHQPNCRFNAEANTGHGSAIFMASVGALRPSASGAG